MKKTIAMILALACCLSLFGCKKEAAPQKEPTKATEKTPTNASTDAPATVSTEEASQATLSPTEASADVTLATTEVPTETTEDPTQVPTEMPATVPVEAPNQAPTMAPTGAPSQMATAASVSASATVPTGATGQAPTMTSATAPTRAPVQAPTMAPTRAPVQAPTMATAGLPNTAPTGATTQAPVMTPATVPAVTSSQAPTMATAGVPSTAPAQASPTMASIGAPATVPAVTPSQAPTKVPVTVLATVPIYVPTIVTVAPTKMPAQLPTAAPTKAPVTVLTTVQTQAPVIPIRPTVGDPDIVLPTSPATLPTWPTQTPATAPTQAPATAPNQTPATAPTQTPATAPNQAPTEHIHTFGDWILQAMSTCTAAGREERRCACGISESRELPLEDHRMNGQICRNCHKVIFDDNAALVELGVVVDSKYGAGSVANKVWDIRFWNGKVYRAAGDYDKNTGKAMIAAYDIKNCTWDTSFSASDNAIHGFEVIGGKLVAPGVDATESWDYGNYYVLGDDGKWQKVRNLPNGVHCFDMIQCGDKIFAALGTEKVANTVAVSEDGGNTFTFAPLYKDGAPYDLSTFKMSRTYEFVQLEGKVYALVYFQTKTGYARWAVFGYEDGKMHYLAEGNKLIDGSSFSRKYFGGELELNGKCYLSTRALYVIEDFSDPASWNTISMPNSGKVSDVILRDGVIYVLSSRQDMKTKIYHVVIYKSTTGEPGSFTEVASYDYGGFPMCFDYDGEHFYVGTGLNAIDDSKLGMVLRVKPN